MPPTASPISTSAGWPGAELCRHPERVRAAGAVDLAAQPRRLHRGRRGRADRSPRRGAGPPARRSPSDFFDVGARGSSSSSPRPASSCKRRHRGGVRLRPHPPPPNGGPTACWRSPTSRSSTTTSCSCCAGSPSRCRDGQIVALARRQRRRQDDDAAGDHRSARRPRRRHHQGHRSSFEGNRIDGKDAVGDRAARASRR